MSIYDFKIVRMFSDIIEFFRFRRHIKSVENQRDSLYNVYKLNHNKIGNIVYVQLNFTELDYYNAQCDEKLMVDTKLGPIVTYLSGDLGWGEYLRLQISNFVDNNGQRTLSYAVNFIFDGYSNLLTNMVILAILGVGAIGTGIWALISYVL